MTAICPRNPKRRNNRREGVGMSDTNYSRITLKVRDEWDFRNVVKQVADKNGESVNGYMIKAIRNAVIADGGAFPVSVLEKEAEKAE